MTRHRRDRGGATLATAVIVLLAGSLLAAAVAEIARTELVVARSRRITADGLAAADACLARVTAALPAGWDQTSALAGPDGIAGTVDDGMLPAPGGCAATLVPGPLGALRPFLDVAASVPGGGRRLRAIIGAAPAPLPALLWAESAAALGHVGGRVELDGVDPARPDLPALPALVSPDDPALADAWIAGTPGIFITGATARAEFAPAPRLRDTLSTRLIDHGALPAFTPAPTPPPLALHAVAGDLVIATAGYGTGVLAVDGRLDIQADFAFSGVVAASGGVGVASGATLRIGGGLWLGAPAFDVAGLLVVRHDRTAVDAVDARFRLPRRAAVAGVVDR